MQQSVGVVVSVQVLEQVRDWQTLDSSTGSLPGARSVTSVEGHAPAGKV